MRSGTEIEIILDLIRHGRTAGNEAGKYIGRTDEPLSLSGRKEIETRSQQPEPVDMVFISPMKRCMETADILFPRQKKRVIPEWREIDFGDFEGKSYKELSGNPDYQAWIDSNGRMAFPNGESREAFISRSMDGFRQVLSWGREKKAAEAGASGFRLAGIVHGGTIMAVCSSLTGQDYYAYQVKNGQGFRLTLGYTEPFVDEKSSLWVRSIKQIEEELHDLS